MVPDTEWVEVRQYIRRFERLSPEELLEIMEQLRLFFYENMTPDGKRFVEQEKHHGFKTLISKLGEI